MESASTPVSSRSVSPICKGTEARVAQQASIPTLLKSCALPPSMVAATQRLSVNPSPLLERRGQKNPPLKVNAFQAAGVGAGASRSEPATLYDVLQLPQTASDSEIKTAYRRLARQYHPDMVPLEDKEASTTKFLQLNAAYSALSDPPSRARYDLQLSLQSFHSSGYKGRFSRTPRFYTPTGATPSSSSSSSSSSTSYCSPRTPFSTGRGKSWETDQCWC